MPRAKKAKEPAADADATAEDRTELNENEILLDADPDGNRYLPGAEEIVDKEIAAAAGEYHSIKTDRVALLAKEIDAKEFLADVCHKKKDLFKTDPDNTDSKIYRVGRLIIRVKNEWKEQITTEIKK